MPLKTGEPAPWFRGATPSNPEFTFDSVAGRYILLAFLPLEDAPRVTALRSLAAHQQMFDDARLSAFGVVRDAQTAADRGWTPLRTISSRSAGPGIRARGAPATTSSGSG